MTERCDVAIVGSGFAGSLLARILVGLGYEVTLLERGAHPRFAIGESSTPLANLSLERIGRRYGLTDCHNLATHGRWMRHFPAVRRGLKRGFTFYRHHPGRGLGADLGAERLLVAASPNDAVADTHWLRADVDHHFVREAIAAGVDYRDRVELTGAVFDAAGARLSGHRHGEALSLQANFVIDASGPSGFLARHLPIASALQRVRTKSALVFGHFGRVRLMNEAVPGMPEGPYPDDWAAVHHVIDEGWMYSLRFDHGVTSAGFLLSPQGLASLRPRDRRSADTAWRALLGRYPILAAAFEESVALMPLAFRPRIQHRLARAAGDRWALLPHTFAFVDPLFSTGIAWSLRAVERLALGFERRSRRSAPPATILRRYDALLAAEADQIDTLVSGAYDAMTHFDLFAAHALIYFAAVSFAEARQRLAPDPFDAWSGFLGVGDPVLGPLPAASRRRLRRITRGRGLRGDASSRRAYVAWATAAIAARNIGGFGDPSRHHLYPVDLDLLVDRHALLGMSREQLSTAIPGLRGMGPERH